MDEAEKDVTLIQARVAGMLLMELTEALLMRGAIRREDVAGALLRTEYRVEMAESVAEDCSISGIPAAIAQTASEEWEARFGLQPDMFLLRKLQHEWVMRQASGQAGRSPLHPDRIAALYDDAAA